MSDLEFSIAGGEIHSFDSFIGRMIRKNDTVVFPVINIGISDHPLNGASQLTYIDKSYIFLEHVISIEEDYDLVNEEADFNVFYLGGLDMINGTHREWKIECTNVKLILSDDSKFSNNMWLLENMDKERVNEFLNSYPK